MTFVIQSGVPHFAIHLQEQLPRAAQLVVCTLCMRLTFLVECLGVYDVHSPRR